MDFTVWFGTSRASGNSSFVTGDVFARSNHCSIATRSKVGRTFC